jgi:hypothetical protein
MFRRHTHTPTWVVEDIYRRDETLPWWTVIVARQDGRETHVISLRILPITDAEPTGAIYEAAAKEMIRQLVQQSDDALQLNATHHTVRVCTDAQ